jgi:hypothetical protein
MEDELIVKRRSRDTFVLSTVLAASVSMSAPVKPRWIEVKRGAWPVRVATLSAMQTGIEKSLLVLWSHRHQALLPLSSYAYQYQGQTDNAGRRIVAIFRLCDDFGRQDLAEQGSVLIWI